MERTEIDYSSNIHSVGYDAATELLEIQFKRKGAPGPVYQYSGVPLAVVEGLMSATSKGQYFDAHIKGKYGHQKVSE